MSPSSREQVVKKMFDLWARDVMCIPIRVTVPYRKKGEGISHKDSRGSWFLKTNLKCKYGIGFGGKGGTMTFTAPQKVPKQKVWKLHFWRWGSYSKGELVCQRQSAFCWRAVFCDLSEEKALLGDGGKLQRKVLIPPGWERCWTVPFQTFHQTQVC